MKIKTKKQMNLLQLIEHIIKTNYKPEVYKSNTTRAVVEVGVLKSIIFKTIVFPEDIFTVEVEEEITEDTEFEILYYMTFLGGIFKSMYPTIKSTLEHSLNDPIALYILNDDLKMTLIWRDGKLVE